MTSLTMYDSWTAPTMLSLWTQPKSKRANVVAHISTWVKVIDTAVVVLCPLVVSAGALFAAATWPAPTDAETVGTSTTGAFYDVNSATPGQVQAPR